MAACTAGFIHLLKLSTHLNGARALSRASVERSASSALARLEIAEARIGIARRVITRLAVAGFGFIPANCTGFQTFDWPRIERFNNDVVQTELAFRARVVGQHTLTSVLR